MSTTPTVTAHSAPRPHGRIGRRLSALLAMAVVLSTGTVGLSTSPAAAAELSTGCIAMNDPAIDGTFAGRRFNLLSFNAGETLTIGYTAADPTKTVQFSLWQNPFPEGTSPVLINKRISPPVSLVERYTFPAAMVDIDLNINVSEAMGEWALSCGIEVPITATAPSPTYAAGDTIPSTFTPTYTGYGIGQSPTTAPTCTTTATSDSPAGTYPITCTGGDPQVAGDTNSYTFSYVPGTLTITGPAVEKRPQTITFEPNLIGIVFETQTLTATSDSGLPVAFSTAESSGAVCDLVDGVLTYKRTGRCDVFAFQAGDDTYLPANTPTARITIYGQADTITFTPETPATVGSSQVLTATSASGLPVYFDHERSPDDPAVCSLDLAADGAITVTYLRAGVCKLFAFNEGDGEDFAPTTLSAPVTVIDAPVKTDQTITFTPDLTGQVGKGQLLTANSDSDLPVSFTLDEKASGENVCSLTGAALTYLGAGTCVVVASQPGNESFAAADDVEASIVVTKVDQRISFSPTLTGMVGETQTLTATSNSRLEVTLAVEPRASTNGACRLEGSTLVYLAAGDCTILATQGGNDTFAPALSVTRTIVITRTPAPVETDSDGDGLSDATEIRLGTNPEKRDSDGDGLTDGREVNGIRLTTTVYTGVGTRPRSTTIGLVRTNPLRKDTDRDGLTDGAEVAGTFVKQIVRTHRPGTKKVTYVIGTRVTNPTKADTDGDGLTDRQEITGSRITGQGTVKSDPTRADTDLGGVRDGAEVRAGNNPSIRGR